MTNANSPVEYQKNIHKYGKADGDFDGFSKWKAEDMVKARINDALKAMELDEDVRDAINFRVTIVNPSYGLKSTRIYEGDWSGQRGTFVSSKKGESIDLDKAIAFILENARASARRRAVRDEKARDGAVSSEKAKALSEELVYMGRVRIWGSDYADKVNVRFDADLSVEDARKVAEFLKGF